MKVNQNKGLQSEDLTVVLNTQKNNNRMSTGFFKILIYLIVFATTAGYSQEIPWVVQPSSVIKDINLDINHTLFEGDTLLLGAFYGSSTGVAKCGGYARIPGDTILRTYGKDAYSDGFMNGEEYQFRVYNPKKGCYMLLGYFPLYTFGSQVYQYLDDSSLSVNLPSVVYPQTVSCRSNKDLAPIIYNNLTTTFSSTPSGLAIDSLTGTISTRNSKTGVYKVKAITESCLLNDTSSITITNEKDIFYSKDTVVCNGEAQIGTFLNAESYLWSTGESDPYIIVTKSGEYTLELADTNGCFSKDTFSVKVFNSSQGILGSDTTVCSSSYILAAPEGYTYQWSTKSTDRSITVYYSGKYSVTAKVESCTIDDSIYITLKEPVQFDLGKDTSVLCASPFNLKGPFVSSGYKYLWSTGDTSETIKVNKSGMFTLNLTDKDGCESSDNIYIDFSNAVDNPEINLGPDTIVCAESIILTGKSGNVNKWSTEESGDFIEVKTNGKYYVTVEDQYGCINSDTINVQFQKEFSLGNISVEIKSLPCEENINVTLVPDSHSGTFPLTYNLIKNGVVVSNSTNGVFDNVHEGNYNFEIVDSRGCKASGTNKSIAVKKVEPCPEKVLAFTGASQPSYFIGFPGMTKIYDMSGILIKTIPTPAEWDGTGNNGEIVPMGDYIIVCGENQRIVVTVIK